MSSYGVSLEETGIEIHLSEDGDVIQSVAGLDPRRAMNLALMLARLARQQGALWPSAQGEDAWAQLERATITGVRTAVEPENEPLPREAVVVDTEALVDRLQDLSRALDTAEHNLRDLQALLGVE